MNWLNLASAFLAALWSSRVTRIMLALTWLVLLFGPERVAGWIENLGVQGAVALVRGVATFGAELASPEMLSAPEVPR